MSPVASWAKAYASVGCVVMPLNRMKNTPHMMLGEFGSFDEFERADDEQIERWWRIDPAANIGIIPGARSGFIAIDVDRKKGVDGHDSLTRHLEENDLDLDLNRARVVTPSGGYHLWFRLPKDVEVSTNTRWLDNVEIRGSRGQIAVPPSVRQIVHKEQFTSWTELRRYVEVPGPVPCDPDAFPEYRSGMLWWLTDAPVAPDWLLADATTQRATRTNPRTGEREPLGRLPATDVLVEHGFEYQHRNDDCYRLALRLWMLFNDEATVVSIVHKAWENTSQYPDPFPWHEANKAIRSAEKRVKEMRR